MASQEIQRHQPDILGLCEVDRFDDLEVDLADDGYEGTYKRKRSFDDDVCLSSGLAYLAFTPSRGYIGI